MQSFCTAPRYRPLFPLGCGLRIVCKSCLTKEDDAERTAVLVLYGICTQKPYETRDQFARGLLGFLRNTPTFQ
jgi:hypothetical protein